MLKFVKVNLGVLPINERKHLFEKVVTLTEGKVNIRIEKIINFNYLLIDCCGDWLFTDTEEMFTESKYNELTFEEIMKMYSDELIREMRRRDYYVITTTSSIINSLSLYEKDLLELYKTIAKNNIEHTLILSGSLAMKLQGVKVTRECRDLDIAVDCKPDEVKLPTSFKLQEEKPYRTVYSKQYINEDGNIVDMFESDEKYDKIGGYKVAKLENIKKNKRLFILRNAFDKKKHEMDIHLIEEEEYLKKNKYIHIK